MLHHLSFSVSVTEMEASWDREIWLLANASSKAWDRTRFSRSLSRSGERPNGVNGDTAFSSTSLTRSTYGTGVLVFSQETSRLHCSAGCGPGSTPLASYPAS